MRKGDVVNMTSWKHYQPTIQAGYAAPKGRVGVFLLLGDADKRSPDLFDAEAALNSLGWFPETDFNEAKEQELARAAWELRNSQSHFDQAPFADFWIGWLSCAKSRVNQ